MSELLRIIVDWTLENMVIVLYFDSVHQVAWSAIHWGVGSGKWDKWEEEKEMGVQFQTFRFEMPWGHPDGDVRLLYSWVWWWDWEYRLHGGLHFSSLHLKASGIVNLK